MTGYTVHTGATEKFVAGWDQIFKKQARTKRPAAGKNPAAQKKKKPAPMKNAVKKVAKKIAKSKGRKAAMKKH